MTVMWRFISVRSRVELLPPKKLVSMTNLREPLIGDTIIVTARQSRTVSADRSGRNIRRDWTVLFGIVVHFYGVVAVHLLNQKQYTNSAPDLLGGEEREKKQHFYIVYKISDILVITSSPRAIEKTVVIVICFHKIYRRALQLLSIDPMYWASRGYQKEK